MKFSDYVEKHTTQLFKDDLKKLRELKRKTGLPTAHYIRRFVRDGLKNLKEDSLTEITQDAQGRGEYD